jgi:hypothetical protein
MFRTLRLLKTEAENKNELNGKYHFKDLINNAGWR